MKKIFYLISTLIIITIFLTSCKNDQPIIESQSEDSQTEITQDEKKSDYIIDKSIWTTPYRTESGFAIDLAVFHADNSGIFKSQLIRNSIKKYNLGGIATLTPEPFAGEWGITFTGQRGKTDGRGETVISDSYTTPPDTHKEALRRLFEFLPENYKLTSENHPWTSMNGVYPWQHYAGELGFDQIGVEIGEAISSYQGKIAFTRGAGRQYDKTWFVDFSSWHQGYMLDYSESYGAEKIWQEGGVDNGHSMNLLNRAFMMSYMSGTNFFIAEAGSLLTFYNKLTSEGLYELTPYGETMQKCNAFATKNPDIGTTYTPFGVVLDYYHGSSGGDDGIRNDAKFAFNTLAYSAGDNMSYELLNMFFPDSFQVVGKKETTVMVDSPYGDTCDVLLQNASQEVLNSYPVLILSGSIELSEQEKARYQAYVEQGGTLVVNTAYLSQFPDYKASYSGKGTQTLSVKDGSVIIYGEEYSVTDLKDILTTLTKKYIPFTFSQGIEYIVNVNENSLLLTVINNNGVSKEPSKPVVIDENSTISLGIHYTGTKAIASAKELVTEKDIAVADNNVNVTLAPGDVEVIEFQLNN